jgi:UDP-MurNAc hydroxylase
MASPSCIEYLGHAGFVVNHGGKRVLIDPWFYPAFLASWFPYPDNRFLLEQVTARRYDYLYISHTHEDHFDRRLLEALDKNITVLCPAFRSRALAKKLRGLGFEKIVSLGHKQSFELAPGLRATVLLDTSHKEDSALLLDLDGYRFLDLNDCNTALSELPDGVDLLAAQFSGAMWYPNCYDYPPDVMRRKVARVRADLMATLVSKCRATGARVYLPSAGPACFLDPALWRYNDRDATIFPLWNDVQNDFTAACPATRVLSVRPGDILNHDGGQATVARFAGEQPDEDLAAYSERRRDEWQAFHATLDRPVTSAEIVSYFGKLQWRNRHLLCDFSKMIRLAAGDRTWGVRLGELARDFVIEGEEPYDPDYELLMPARVLRAVLDGEAGWEEALLSMRVNLHRDPDLFDSRLMGLLRYGNEPAQTLQMSREINCKETIERDGVRMQRFCPHAGEDLKHATVCGGVVECPRHHWKWDTRTGECIEGGTLKLRVEPASGAAEAHEATAALAAS